MEVVAEAEVFPWGASQGVELCPVAEVVGGEDAEFQSALHVGDMAYLSDGLQGERVL